jgi:hypothetical protein
MKINIKRKQIPKMKRYKRINRKYSQLRDLEIVRLRLSGMTVTDIARRYRVTSARITQILHRIAAKLAPRAFRS